RDRDRPSDACPERGLIGTRLQTIRVQMSDVPVQAAHRQGIRIEHGEPEELGREGRVELGKRGLRGDNPALLDDGLLKVLEPPFAVGTDARAARSPHRREPPALVELESVYAAIAIIRRLLPYRDDCAAVFRPRAAIAHHADVAESLEHLHLT